MRRALCGMLFALALTGCSSHHSYGVTPDAPVADSLVGQWTPVSATMGGNDFPVANFNGGTLRMNNGAYEFAGDNGTYAILSYDVPARMDILGVSGPNAGKTIPALYRISGDELTVAYQLGTGVRPRDFSSPTGSKILVIRYRRGR